MLDVKGRALKVAGPPNRMLTEIDRLKAIREARPAESLFAEKDWLLSPEPFAIDEKNRRELERLGHQLFVFQRACNQLYQQSVKGKQPNWVARYLDLGKPRGTNRILRAGKNFARTSRVSSGPIWS